MCWGSCNIVFKDPRSQKDTSNSVFLAKRSMINKCSGDETIVAHTASNAIFSCPRRTESGFPICENTANKKHRTKRKAINITLDEAEAHFISPYPSSQMYSTPSTWKCWCPPERFTLVSALNSQNQDKELYFLNVSENLCESERVIL